MTANEIDDHHIDAYGGAMHSRTVTSARHTSRALPPRRHAQASRGPSRRARAALCALVAFGLGAGCGDDLAETFRYRAEIRWTENEIPHITAQDLGGVFFGQGYAFASLGGCVLADQVVKVRSQRARLFGPGPGNANVTSDLALLALGLYETAATSFTKLSTEAQQAITAYAAGYNQYLAEHKARMPCWDKEWVAPISEIDLLAHYLELSTFTSGRALSQLIVAAQPPTVANRQLPDVTYEQLRTHRVGSNGWAIGSERSAGGGGMLLANPHFPWEGELKLYESHLTVPGKLDIYGASLLGVLGVIIGFNADVAWTATVSDGQRFTLYQLQLDPSDPTSYLYEGSARKMDAKTYEVQVRQPDGQLATVSRTLYRTHFGPMVMLPPIGWTGATAFAMRDTNVANLAIIDHILQSMRAGSLAELQRVHDEVSGLPWVNTIAVSKEGRAWYVDSSATPALSPAAAQAWLDRAQTDPLTAALAAQDLTLLPGNSALFEWQELAGARSPGLTPVSQAPRLERDDFVFNANDSYWLANPLAPLTGYSPMYGVAGTPRSARTRMNAVMLLDEDRSWSGPDHRFDLDELRAAVFSNRGLLADQLRDPVLARCRAATAPVPYEGELIELAPACDALAAWDRRAELDSEGAVLWREVLGDFPEAAITNAGELWAEPFDPSSGGAAIATPRGLAPPGNGEDRIQRAIAAAVVKLRRAGLSPRAKLRDTQGSVRGDVVVPVHGGVQHEGVINLMLYGAFKSTLAPEQPRGTVLNERTGLTADGKYVINSGTSFLMALEYTAQGPRAYGLLAYGQSDDPQSPYYRDQTLRLSEKSWRPLLFTRDEVAAAKARVEVVTAPVTELVPL